jgi:hypothetical protein
LVSITTNTGSSNAAGEGAVGMSVRWLVNRRAFEYNRRLFGRFIARIGDKTSASGQSFG